MQKFLPFTFLLTIASIFGILWIVFEVDPETNPWRYFTLFVFLVFIFFFCFLGTVLYFLRTRFYKKYDRDWYFKTSFKMSFFVAFFLALFAVLGVLKLITLINVSLALLVVVIFAFYSYLGKRS
ncbi:hypothetical protein HY382_01575 [Candidatus Curtissbacteria bacterium]|nr:hypothetical protein [Candidatus Curtissbacteria bacterium]